MSNNLLDNLNNGLDRKQNFCFNFFIETHELRGLRSIIEILHYFLVHLLLTANSKIVGFVQILWCNCCLIFAGVTNVVVQSITGKNDNSIEGSL